MTEFQIWSLFTLTCMFICYLMLNDGNELLKSLILPSGLKELPSHYFNSHFSQGHGTDDQQHTIFLHWTFVIFCSLRERFQLLSSAHRTRNKPRLQLPQVVNFGSSEAWKPSTQPREINRKLTIEEQGI